MLYNSIYILYISSTPVNYFFFRSLVVVNLFEFCHDYYLYIYICILSIAQLLINYQCTMAVIKSYETYELHTKITLNIIKVEKYTYL